MSAMNPPCVAELTFMKLLPIKMKDMTDAMLKLSGSMDRLSAAVEKHNEQELVVQTVQAPISVDLLARAVEKDMKPMPVVKDLVVPSNSRRLTEVVGRMPEAANA